MMNQLMVFLMRIGLVRDASVFYIGGSDILPAPLKENLHRGHLAFAAQEDIADDANDALFDECDSVFYQHEQLLTDLLRAYAKASFH